MTATDPGAEAAAGSAHEHPGAALAEHATDFSQQGVAMGRARPTLDAHWLPTARLARAGRAAGLQGAIEAVEAALGGPVHVDQRPHSQYGGRHDCRIEEVGCGISGTCQLSRGVVAQECYMPKRGDNATAAFPHPLVQAGGSPSFFISPGTSVRCRTTRKQPPLLNLCASMHYSPGLLGAVAVAEFRELHRALRNAIAHSLQQNSTSAQLGRTFSQIVLNK